MNRANEFQLDIGEFFRVIWKEKITVVLVTVIFTGLTVYYATTLQNIYKAEVLLAPAGEESSIGGLSGQLGSIAAIAGVGVASDNGERVQLALETLVSRKFLSEFVNKHDILLPLMALSTWDPITGNVTYDETQYDLSQNKWIREVHPSRSVIPTDWEAHKNFVKLISYEKKRGSGYIQLSVESVSPVFANQWLGWLVDDLNETIKEQELEEINKNINYLTEQLQKTQLAEMRKIFYQLIEEQIKKRMLAEVQDEYVFKVIDPSVIPEDKDRPNRAIICVLGMILSFLLSVAISLVKYFLQKSKLSD